MGVVGTMSGRATIMLLAVLTQFLPALAQAPKGGSAPAPAGKAGDTGADMTTATFGDWQLRCRNTVPAAAGQPAIPRSCEVVQSVIIQGQGSPFAQLAFGKAAPNEPLLVTMVLPTNIALPSTVRLMMDDKDNQPVDLAWTRCMPGGCFASAPARDEHLRRWRGSEEAGRFSFKNSGGQDVTLPFSFRGLARALDALAKEG